MGSNRFCLSLLWPFVSKHFAVDFSFKDSCSHNFLIFRAKLIYNSKSPKCFWPKCSKSPKCLVMVKNKLVV